jgi:hypothetical protein
VRYWGPAGTLLFISNAFINVELIYLLFALLRNLNSKYYFSQFCYIGTIYCYFKKFNINIIKYAYFMAINVDFSML